MKRFLFCLFVIVGLLTACAPDPRKEAAAFETISQAEQAARDAEQAREHKQTLNHIAEQRALQKQEIFSANVEKMKIMTGIAVYIGGITMILVLIYVIISAGKNMNVVIEGVSNAVVRKMMVQANLIYIDKSSGTFPQLLEYLGSGKYSLTDLGDHSTIFLDTHNAPDRIAVRGAIAIRHALVMSSAAAKSKDPTGVAMIQPLIIEQEMEN